MPPDAVATLTAAHRFFSLEELQQQVGGHGTDHMQTLSWCTVGVLVSKSVLKNLGSGERYRILRFSDLRRYTVVVFAKVRRRRHGALP